MEQRVLVGQTHILVSYPRIMSTGEWIRAVPSSVKIKVSTPSTSLPDSFEDAATLADLVDASTTAAAAEGSTSITVDSAFTTRGYRYLLNAPDADSSYIEVEAAKSESFENAALPLAEPLPCAVASGASFRGWACYHALTAAETSDPGEGLAIWQAVLNGHTYEWAQAFRIVRRIPLSTLTPTELTRSYPIVSTMRSRQDVDLEEIITTSWEHVVVPWLFAHQIDPENVVSVDALLPMHALACVRQLALLHTSLPDRIRDDLERRWEQVAETTLARRDFYEEEQVETPAPRPEEPVRFGTFIRTTR